MTTTTFKTLEQAFASQAPKPKPKLLPPVLANEPLPELIITGPINRVMEL